MSAVRLIPIFDVAFTQGVSNVLAQTDWPGLSNSEIDDLLQMTTFESPRTGATSEIASTAHCTTPRYRTAAPATAMSVPAAAKTGTTPAPAARRLPVPRLPTTTNDENTACEIVMTRPPERCSASPASALAATSEAPDVAPTSSIPIASDAQSRASNAANSPASASVTSRIGGLAARHPKVPQKRPTAANERCEAR